MTVVLLIGTFFVILRDVPWEDIFKLGASAVLNEFRVQVRIDVYIPNRKYQDP